MSKVDAKMQAYIDKATENWPDPTPEQIEIVRTLLFPAKADSKEVAERQRAERAEFEARRAEVKRIKDYAASLMACNYCGLPEAAHRNQGALSAFHAWEPRQDVLVMIKEAADE